MHAVNLLQRKLKKSKIMQFCRHRNQTSESGAGATRLGRLLAQTAALDQVAFEELYSETIAKMFSTAMPIVRQRTLAEEVVQETYVRVWSRASTYKPSLSSPITWMATIARNLAIDLVRRSAREKTHNDCIPHLLYDDVNYDGFERLSAFQDDTSFEVALQALDPLKRQLIEAAYINGETRKAMSARFGMPVNTIKTRIRRALLEAKDKVDQSRTATVTTMDDLVTQKRRAIV